MARKPRGKRRPPKVKFRRRDEKFAGLDKEFHPKARWEYIDMDYIDQLSDEEKAILSKFIDEYYGAALAPADNPEKWDEDFHNTEETRKQCRDRNNARNRDIYSILRTRGWVEGIEGNIEEINLTSQKVTENQEAVLVEAIDKTKKS